MIRLFILDISVSEYSTGDLFTSEVADFNGKKNKNVLSGVLKECI